MRNNVPRKVKNTKASTSTPQLDQISPSYYTNGENALEAGTELEEKAERFAIGWKAQKYYEKSLALYNRAISLNSRSHDATYNAARIHFILATSFLSPPSCIDALQQSTSLYRQSLQLSSPVEISDGSPSAFYLDVQFNLAVALLALADQLEHSKESRSVRMAIIDEAVQQFDSVIDGQEIVLQQQRMHEQNASQDDDDSRQEMNDFETQIDDAASDNGERARSEYTASLITPSAALETLYNLHLASLAALDLAQDEVGVNAANRLSSLSVQRAHAVITAFPNGEVRSPDGEWYENVENFRYAQLDLKVAEISKRSSLDLEDGTALFQSLAETSQELTQEANFILIAEEGGRADQSTTKGRAASRIYLQKLEHLGDLLLTTARIQLHYLHTDSSNTILSQSIWSILGLSSKLFLATLKALDTTSDSAGSSAVLGNSNASTATTRRRCSLYTALSTISILRSDTLLLQHIATVDEKTREQLVNNARVYARKAVSEIGLGWLLSATSAAAVQYYFPHGGLESLQGEAEAVLTLIRSLYIRSTVIGAASNLQEAEIVCGNVRQGLLQGEHAAAWKWVLFYPQGATNGKGLLEQIIAEEGSIVVTDQEHSFWSQVETRLMS